MVHVQNPAAAKEYFWGRLLSGLVAIVRTHTGVMYLFWQSCCIRHIQVHCLPEAHGRRAIVWLNGPIESQMLYVTSPSGADCLLSLVTHTQVHTNPQMFLNVL